MSNSRKTISRKSGLVPRMWLCFWLMLIICLDSCQSVNKSTPSPNSYPSSTPLQVETAMATALVTDTLPKAVTLSASPTSISIPVSNCPSQLVSWTQVNVLKGFFPHSGIAENNGCHLWIVGEQVGLNQQGALIQSEDGGQSIQIVASWPHVLRFSGLARNSDGVLWVAGQTIDGSGFLTKSIDKGQNWVNISLPKITTNITALAASDEGLWVCAEGGNNLYLFFSSDGENDWREEESLSGTWDQGVQPRWSDISSWGNTVMAVGSDGTKGVIVISLDGGETFHLASNYGKTTLFLSASLIDANQAYIGGYYTTSGRSEDAIPVLLITRDGGNSFHQISVPTKNDMVVAISFQSVSQGYVILGSNIDTYRVSDENNGENLIWEDMPLTPRPDVLGGNASLFASTDGTIYRLQLGGLYRIRP
jgi:hypothetical protein